MLATTSHFERKRAIAATLYQPLNLLMPHLQPKRLVLPIKQGAGREPYEITMICYDIFAWKSIIWISFAIVPFF